MNKNEFGEIINGVKTYNLIVDKLKKGQAVFIGWTDEEYSHYDILFKLGAYKEQGNYIQRGIKNNDLFISVMSLGSFGFKAISRNKEISSGYLSEKLNFNVGEKFTELVNSVLLRLN